METLVTCQEQLPPIIVHRRTMRVIDGMHRLRAATLLGRRKIAVRYFDGPEEDAFVLAVKSNIAHGLPLSLADRKRAAERVIASHPQWSDRMIASVTGISAKTVAEIRRITGVDAAEGSGRIGKDGRVRSTDVTEGRRLAHEMIIKNPALSLRQVARAAGISPETVRDVKNRVLRGEDPLPQGRSRELVGQGVTGTLAAPATLTAGRVPMPGSAPPSAVVVERLRADPALRFNENGRDLLRLLNLHTLRTEDWNKIVDSVPPHRMETVAQLARDCARKWLELASLIERNALQA
ncbi:ParB/RepB/Spo0J family partition protein [Actinomadura macra]|uniref:ParB/RepB/Spo0J family partition protein n=1 Tax=Actinomadura macra TaxID=46164 RepID=UPI000A02B50D|nr:ParB N-terminal domain-containing protein [Actinomadura macra]